MSELKYEQRKKVYDIFASRGLEIDTKILSRALAVGAEYLGLSIGFLTRIEDGTQEIVQVTGEHDVIREGASCPLEEAYCQRTVEIDGTLAIEDEANSSEISEAAVQVFELSTYIGTKVLIKDEVYGTVCFADESVRQSSFTESDEVFIELLANLIGQALERRVHDEKLHQRNEQLRQRKQHLEGIAENSSDILFRTGLDSRFTYVSAAAERILGYGPDELVGERITQHITKQSVDDAVHAYAQAADGTTVENLELDFVDADGETVILEVNATPITDGNDVVGIQGVARDTTTRKARMQELSLKNRAIDESEVGVSIADNRQDGTPLVYVNGGFERITGYDADQAIGQNCRYLQGEATDSETTETIRNAIQANEPVSVEILNYRENGTPFWNHLQLNPIEDDTGEVTHYLGFQTDITARKRTERLVGVLNRVLRHNLRNDMNVILGYGDLLEEGSQSDAASIGGRIKSSAEKLISLSEQARKLEADARRERNPERLDLGELCGELEQEYRTAFPSATVDVKIQTDRSVCAGPELYRALSELVENALKHDPSTDPWVQIQAMDDGDEVELTIEDDGGGISKMEAATASQPETALKHGSGLGLWLVNWIVTRYGGSFQIQAKGGESLGTIATVRLPALDSTTTVDAAARKPTVLFR